MIPRYRDVVELVKRGATLEAQQKIVELEEAHLDLREENLRLREQNSELKRRLELAASLEWEPPVYYRVAGGKKEGLYCQKCYDGDQKLVRLQDGFGHAKHFCLVRQQGY